MNNNSITKYMGAVTGIGYDEAAVTLFTNTKADLNKSSVIPGRMEIEISSCGARAIKFHITNHRNRTHIFPEIVSVKKSLSAKINEDDSFVTYTNNMVELKVTKSPSSIIDVYYYGKKLTSVTAFYEADEGSVRSGITTEISPDEKFYGMGGGNRLDLNGSILDIGTDKTSCSHIPFFTSSRNYGVLVNTTGHAHFDFGSGLNPVNEMSVPGEEIEVVILIGDTAKDILTDLSGLIGTAPISPVYSYGLCLSVSDNHKVTSESIISVLDSSIEAGVKYTEIYLGKSWLEKTNPHGFTWDLSRFPDPADFIRKLHDRNIRISLGVTPYISDGTAEYAECFDCNYLMNKKDDSVLLNESIDGGIAILDFSHLGARSWLQIRLDSLLKDGVDYFRGDFSYVWPDFSNSDIKLYSGADPVEFSYSYAGIFSSLLYESAVRTYSQPNAFALVNNTSVGYGSYSSINIPSAPIVNGYNKIASQLKNILSYGLSGYGVTNVEIPEGITDSRLSSAWIQFASMTPHFSIEGGINPGGDNINIIKMFINMRNSMLPYLHSLTCESKFFGLPAMRPLSLEFSNDPMCKAIDTEYMLGSSLLIAPIMSDTSTMYYVPQGIWTDLLTREKVTGPCYKTITNKNQTMPILVRPNSIVATRAQDMSGNVDILNNITFTVFELSEGKLAATELYSADGSRSGIINVIKEGNKITVKTDGFGRSKRIVFAGVKNIVSVSESVPNPSDFGTSIDFSGNELIITLG